MFKCKHCGQSAAERQVSIIYKNHDAVLFNSVIEIIKHSEDFYYLKYVRDGKIYDYSASDFKEINII